jgi:hypothetical protein
MKPTEDFHKQVATVCFFLKQYFYKRKLEPVEEASIVKYELLLGDFAGIPGLEYIYSAVAFFENHKDIKIVINDSINLVSDTALSIAGGFEENIPNSHLGYLVVDKKLIENKLRIIFERYSNEEFSNKELLREDDRKATKKVKMGIEKIETNYGYKYSISINSENKFEVDKSKIIDVLYALSQGEEIYAHGEYENIPSNINKNDNVLQKQLFETLGYNPRVLKKEDGRIVVEKNIILKS